MPLQVSQTTLYVWSDLSEKDMQLLNKLDLQEPDSAAVLAKAAAQTSGRTDTQQAIEMDLFRQTLKAGKVLQASILRLHKDTALKF